MSLHLVCNQGNSAVKTTSKRLNRLMTKSGGNWGIVYKEVTSAAYNLTPLGKGDLINFLLHLWLFVTALPGALKSDCPESMTG